MEKFPLAEVTSIHHFMSSLLWRPCGSIDQLLWFIVDATIVIDSLVEHCI